MSKRLKNILLPIIITLIYLIFLYFIIEYAWKNGLLVSVRGTSPINIGAKFAIDFISNLTIVVLIFALILVRKKPLSDVGITLNSPVIIGVLFIIYLSMFLVRGNFTAIGFYAAFYYLVIVAFSEEFIFRGYLFTVIDKMFGFWIAGIISGLLFGAAHGLMTAIVNEYDITGLIQSVASDLIGQGILGGAIFAYLYKKTKSLFVPILVHAILDYSALLFF